MFPFYSGSESRLVDCVFGGWGNENCDHSEDTGVICGMKVLLFIVQQQTSANLSCWTRNISAEWIVNISYQEIPPLLFIVQDKNTNKFFMLNPEHFGRTQCIYHTSWCLGDLEARAFPGTVFEHCSSHSVHNVIQPISRWSKWWPNYRRLFQVQFHQWKIISSGNFFK